MYTFFPWDCSSIGQSTALSRRKLRVRAPSVPTDPINTLIHLSIFCEKSDKEQIFIPRGDPYSYLDFISFFFLSNFSSNKYGNFHYFNQYRLMGERHMCISTIIGSIIFGYPTVLGLGLAFSITPDPCNGIEYHIVPGSTYTNRIRFLYDTKTK